MKSRWTTLAVVSLTLAFHAPHALAAEGDPDSIETASAVEIQDDPPASDGAITTESAPADQPQSSDRPTFNRGQRRSGRAQTGADAQRSGNRRPDGNQIGGRNRSMEDAQQRQAAARRFGRNRPTRSDEGENRREEGPPPSPGASGIKYDAFKIITDRNIFNPNRSPRSARGARDEAEARPAETITLVGTLSYEKGSYAFFDGSRPELRKAIELGHTIAGHKVVAIGSDTISLQAKTNTFTLRIGGKLRRERDGWEPTEGLVVVGNETNGDAKAAPVGEEDVIKRLMKQRERELGNAD